MESDQGKKGWYYRLCNSRYLSPQPMKVAQPAKKKPKKAKPPKATQPPEAAGEEGEAVPKEQEPSPPIPRVM